MSFFAVLFALLIEQLKPSPRGHRLRSLAARWLDAVAHGFDAGQPRHAWLVWIIAVLGPSALLVALHLLVRPFSVILELLLAIAVLHATLGFRQFSHYFTDLRDALERGDELRVRALLAAWRGLDASELPRAELVRQVIEQSLLAAHRHVFGVFFWFVLLAALGLGPAGAVVYRLSALAAQRWSPERAVVRAAPVPPASVPLVVDAAGAAAGGLSAGAASIVGHPQLGALSARLHAAIDRIPSRMTAFGFAVVGNFEDAINAWRRDTAAAGGRLSNEATILIAASGAIGVRLGGPPAAASGAPAASRPAPLDALDRLRGRLDTGWGELDAAGAAESAAGDARPRVAHLRSIVGLVWRSVVLWMLLLALMTVANLIG